MKRTLIILSLVVISFVQLAPIVKAADPLAVPNNKYGVHILSPDEVGEAAKLVNSNGGKWGYVTIPIRSNDRDKPKWTEFMNRCRELQLIPIVRLSTFVYSDSWVSPSAYDLVDFANFLDELPWPTKNRYIVLFNEPNHANEWGGLVNPGEYAALLFQAKGIFKSRSEDFFLISAGLDMSAPTNKTSLDGLEYYRRMTLQVPNWLDNIDGLSFHAYPNPGFSAPVSAKTRYSLASYQFETSYLLKKLKLSRVSSLPWFITETGPNGRPGFYKDAFSIYWNESNIAAVTPFLLFAGTGNFTNFSLLDINHKPKDTYQDIASLPKVAGSPLQSSSKNTVDPIIETENTKRPADLASDFFSKIKQLLSRPKPTVQVGNTQIIVEIADTPQKITTGLSYRDSLPDNTGMLFKMPTTEQHIFWMYEMHFPLDILWIKDNRVADISPNLLPPAQTSGIPVKVAPNTPVNYVLEVNAGFVSDHGIKVGDIVGINN